MLSQFCICASGKKTQKGKCSVYSTRASPLLLFNAERSCCFHKGVLKVSFAEQRPAVWRRGTGDQKENFWIPEGLCSWVKAMQVKCWHWCPQGHCPTSERLQTCTAEGFFFPKMSLIPCKIHLLQQTASLQAHSPQLLLQQQLSHLPLEVKYHLNIQTTDYLEKKAHEALR